MNVPRRVIVLFLFSAFLISTGVSLFVQSLNHPAGRHIPQMLGLGLVLLFIVIAGRLFHYQQALNQVRQNLEEAQRLASLGSWERDLVSGRGYWSDNCYRLFGLSPRDIAPSMAEFFLMIHHEDRIQAHDTVMEAIRSSGGYEIRYRLDGDSGNRVFLSRGKVLYDEPGQKPITLIGTVQDITHKQRREQLREALLKQKDLFISRLGHDLKTPLTPLVALLPLIRSRTVESRQLELLDLCINSVSHINELVAKTLQLARLASAADVAAPCGNVMLSLVLEALCDNLVETAKNQQIEIKNHIPAKLSVRGNQQELEELFMQLLSNSLKFSPPGSVVSIEAACSNTFVTVMVSDNGIGLSSEELPHIFDDFYKADSSRHLLGSSGLGLTICRRIVENHGGKIFAQSPGRDRGTTISFTLEAGESI